MSLSIADIRRDYKLHALTESGIAADPFTQFDRWWDEAINSQIDEVNAMTLATATKDGVPSARIVLLKGYDEKGFVFYTNYHSDKGETLAGNPRAALVFFWKELERQVRIEGTVSKTSAEESDRYFDSRPMASRIGAWASPQSQKISSRELLEKKFLDLETQYASGAIPRPPHWGGYVVRPTRIEFWQGRSSRLHDRIRYSLSQDGKWTIERLAP
jgi:pyridoxamine 5'-phosphate oxidase